MNINPTFKRLAVLSMAIASALLSSCDNKQSTEKQTSESEDAHSKKIGVLLVSHGSHSKNWRRMLRATQTDVEKDVLKGGKVSGIKTAFMEYTEPTIATQLKAFDDDGYTDVIIVPLLLTVSSHSFDDIPIIAGLRECASKEEELRLESIAVYKAKAKVVLTPLLDFTTVLEKNVVRRAKAMSKNPSEEGLVLVAYGSTPYNKEWEILMGKLEKTVKKETGIDVLNYSWCGHIVHYKLEPTMKAINTTLEKKKKALVIPILVAVDENFQGRIIGGAIEKVNKGEQIVYRHDAILPDPDISQWIMDISAEYAEKAHKEASK